MPFPTPFQVAQGSFDSPTKGGTGEFSITGVGFKPKAIILLTAGNNTVETWQGTFTEAANLGVMMGMAADEGGSINQGALYESSEDGSLSNAHGIHQKVIRIHDATGGLVMSASVSSFDADGFSLDFTDVENLVSKKIGWIAFGGESLVAKISKWQHPTFIGTGNKSITGVGFQPDVVFHMTGGDLRDIGGSPNWPDGDFNATGRSSFRFGVMDKDGNQWGVNISGDGGGPPTNTVRSFSSGQVLPGDNPGLASHDVWASFVSMDLDGFTLQFKNSITTPGWAVSLSLKGLKAKVGTITRPLVTGDVSYTGIGFTPLAVMLGSHHNTVEGETDHATIGLGWSTFWGGGIIPGMNHFAVSRVDYDNVNPAQSKKFTSESSTYYGISTETSHGHVQSLDSDGFTIDWTIGAANPNLIGYVALGQGDRPHHYFEAEFNGVGNGWTNISDDVLLMSPAVDIQYGISGTGPVDLVASTGTMRFALYNGESRFPPSTSAVPRDFHLGLYSPRHPNCRPGFQLGIRIRYSYLIPGTSDGYGKFIGRLKEITPLPGIHRDRKTLCQVSDWMNEAAITKYNVPTQLNKRPDEILTTLLTHVAQQPDSVQFDTGDSTFPYALDNGLVEKATVLTEIQRIAQSEYGRVHIHGGLNYWGRLFFERRTARLIPTPVYTFAGTMQGLSSGSDTAKIRNKAKVTVHPRRVDAVTTTVLFSKPNQNNPAVTPAQTIRISGRYVDPNNPNARIGGTDMQTPLATTDYLMNSAANGSGSNLTANFTVVATYGANQVDYAITNNGGTTGYVTKLQARGRGLYDYDELEAQKENAASIALIGDSSVSLDMPYQSEFTVAEAIAQFLVDTWSNQLGAGVTEASIKFTPRTEEELTAAMLLEPGMAIVASEELSALNDVYFIQNVSLKINGDRVNFEWDLQRALVANFWKLGVAGFSELGVTTVLAPL